MWRRWRTARRYIVARSAARTFGGLSVAACVLGCEPRMALPVLDEPVTPADPAGPPPALAPAYTAAVTIGRAQLAPQPAEALWDGLGLGPGTGGDLTARRPVYADVGSPLPSSQPTPAGGPEATRPAAVGQQYPQPDVTAARTGPQTEYDQFKNRLFETTGTKYVLSLDFVDQQLIGGPTKGYNRGTARFDLGIDQTLWPGGTLSTDIRGGNSDSLDALVPNLLNTNQYAGTPADIFVLRLALYQSFLNDKIVVRVGKLDVGDFIDYNRFGSYNFLAYALAHNPTIPLPGNTLSALLTVRPTRWLTLRGAVSNAAQTPLQPGFDTLHEGEYFQIYELSVAPKVYGQDGTYRFMYWYDNRTLGRIDAAGTESGRGGFALSFDQNVTKKFGLFARYGYAPEQHVFLPVQTWSTGFTWTGPLAGRPADTLAVGVVQNLYGSAHRAVTTDASGSETLGEAYYQYELNPYTSVVPTFQVVLDPAGTHRQGECILGLHVNLHF